MVTRTKYSLSFSNRVARVRRESLGTFGGTQSHSPCGRLSSWASIRRPRRSNVVANSVAWLGIIVPFFSLSAREDRRVLVSRVPKWEGMLTLSCMPQAFQGELKLLPGLEPLR